MVCVPSPARSETGVPSLDTDIQEHSLQGMIALNHCFKNWNESTKSMLACVLCTISKWSCMGSRSRPVLFPKCYLIWPLVLLIHKPEQPQQQLYEELSPEQNTSPSTTAASFLCCKEGKFKTSGVYYW